jgi:hypothetical protein
VLDASLDEIEVLFVCQFNSPVHAAARQLMTMNVTLPTRMVSLDPEVYQSPLTIGLATILTAFLSLLTFVSYTPRLDKRVPKFTSDTYPFIGAANFMWRKR